jgi:hypothetical protein
VCGDGTYDFAYTDGTPETALPLARIRRPAQCAREGDTTVEVNGGFVGKVTRDCRDDVYEVVYTYMNEKTTTTKPIAELRVLREADVSKLVVGAKVEVQYRGGTTWYPGTVAADNGDQTYDIAYDDGDKESRVTPDYIREPDCAPFAERPIFFNPGDAVWWKSLSGTWTKGVVARFDFNSGKYFIDDDDVPVEWVRIVMRDDNLPALNFRDVVFEYSGRCRQGKVARVCGDGLCDFIFDDGTVECGVPTDLVRRLSFASYSPSPNYLDVFDGSPVEANLSPNGGGTWRAARVVSTERVNDVTFANVIFFNGEIATRLAYGTSGVPTQVRACGQFSLALPRVCVQNPLSPSRRLR